MHANRFVRCHDHYFVLIFGDSPYYFRDSQYQLAIDWIDMAMATNQITVADAVRMQGDVEWYVLGKRKEETRK
jgi:uncharacterized protein YdeI (BOF family)